MRNRNEPETAGRRGPVAWCSVEPSSSTAPLSPRTPSDDQQAEREDDRRVPEREEEADAQRPLALAHQLARRVVDRGDVVGVERVAQAERVGGDARGRGRRPRSRRARSGAARRARAGGQEADDVQAHDRGRERAGAAPLGRRQRRLDPRPSGACSHRRRHRGHRTPSLLPARPVRDRADDPPTVRRAYAWCKSFSVTARRCGAPPLGRRDAARWRVRHAQETHRRDDGQQRHDDRAGDAPDADRVDREELAVGQVGAEAEAGERERGRDERGLLAAHQQRGDDERRRSARPSSATGIPASLDQSEVWTFSQPCATAQTGGMRRSGRRSGSRRCRSR